MGEVYDIYHDESRQESFWHGFLFVPRSQRKYLLGLMQKSRIGAKWENAISFKDIMGGLRCRSPRAKLAESWLSIALASIQQQKLIEIPTSFFICSNPREYHLRMERLIKCKFVVFKERDNHEKMFRGLSKMKKIEITLKMGALGGIHKLFNERDPIEIGNIFISIFGYTQNLKTALQNFARYLVENKRNYVSFSKDAKIIPQDNDHKKIKPSQNPEDSHFLQLCDIFLGGVRHHSYCPKIKSIKYKVSYPCCLLLNHDIDNYVRMKESRFFCGFTFGEAWLENENWQFGVLKLKESMLTPRFTQIKLSNF